jgi:uncharacterized protein YxjI
VNDNEKRIWNKCKYNIKSRNKKIASINRKINILNTNKRVNFKAYDLEINILNMQILVLSAEREVFARIHDDICDWGL